jgi:hypothetical protein
MRFNCFCGKMTRVLSIRLPTMAYCHPLPYPQSHMDYILDERMRKLLAEENRRMTYTLIFNKK